MVAPTRIAHCYGISIGKYGILQCFVDRTRTSALCLDHGAIPPCNSCALRSHSCGCLFVYYSRITFGYSVCPHQSVLCSAVARWVMFLLFCPVLRRIRRVFYCPKCQLSISLGVNSPSHNRKIASTINLSCIFHKKVVSLHPKWFTLGNVGGIVLIKNWEFWIKKDSPTRHDSFQDIIKRRLLALVLVDRNPAKFRNPKQDSDKCPLVCFIRCVPQR